MTVNHNVLLAFKEVPTLFIITSENVFQNRCAVSLILVDDAPHVISSFPLGLIILYHGKGLLSSPFVQDSDDFLVNLSGLIFSQPGERFVGTIEISEAN
jgi:hypothetical protein